MESLEPRGYRPPVGSAKRMSGGPSEEEGVRAGTAMGGSVMTAYAPIAGIADAAMLTSMEQIAVAYRVRDKLIIGSLARTSMGVGLEVDPHSMAISTFDGDLVVVIEKALAGSGVVVAHPTQDQWKGMFLPFTQAAGARSYKAFMEDAAYVEIKRSDRQLELIPHLNLGPKDGFEPIPSDKVVLPAGDLIEAASVLKALLDRQGS